MFQKPTSWYYLIVLTLSMIDWGYKQSARGYTSCQLIDIRYNHRRTVVKQIGFDLDSTDIFTYMYYSKCHVNFCILVRSRYNLSKNVLFNSFFSNILEVTEITGIYGIHLWWRKMTDGIECFKCFVPCKMNSFGII